MKRPVVGIPFNYDETWIGGTYYIKNLVNSLNLITTSEQPEVWIISHSETSFDFIKQGTGYPRLHWVKPSMIQGLDGGISRKIKLLSWLTPKLWKQKFNFDMIFPYPIDTKLQQTVCWIPDFQDKRLPNFFSTEELKAREAQHRSYFSNFQHIVFSSRAAQKDFDEFYPEASVKKYVVHFATFEPVQAEESGDQVLKRYGLPEKFFYCPNQFWIHKNHDTVIRAVKSLQEEGIEITVVFSGKEHDHRAPDYSDKLRKKVAELGLTKNIHFIGFIPREDQMVIFRRATCIVQPSLFEGWSTVIEDAKSVSQLVIASSLPSNIEQADENIEFFEATDSVELAKLLKKYNQTPPPRKALDYRKYQQEFADSFMSVVYSVMNSHKP